MNKAELIAAVAENAELTKKDAEKAVKAFIDVVTDELKKGEKVQVVGFIIEDIVKNDDTYKCLNIKTKLHKEDVALVYNRKFLTKVPLRFIEEQLNIKIK